MIPTNDTTLDVTGRDTISSLRIPLDPIHGGLRMAVFGSFVGTGVLTFGAGLALIPQAMLITVLAAAAGAAGVSMGVERMLKERWPSGREFVADQNRIALTKDSKIESVVNPQQQVNVLTWRFEVKKDGPRAKKGWFVLGMALEQDDTYVVIYTTASPDDVEKMPIAEAFTKLEKKERNQKASVASAGRMRRAGEQKRLHDAEIARQIAGGDMMFDAFVETIVFMQKNFPSWMIND